VDMGRDPRTSGVVSDALTGRLLDRRYLVGPRIARGGMASVYEATDTRLDRVVAIKIMHPGLGDALDSSTTHFADRFVREAQASARLTHEHIVSVYDQGEDDGTVYLVMEYVPGHTLRDVIRLEAPMPPLRALATIEPVLSALAAAHRAGIMHRDVKPENVLIADDGRVKVADFGLAKAVSADTQHTATGGVLIGTVSYLAPELVIDGRADARADVYAAGVLLYELLTGSKPHDGESPIQVAYKHVHEDVPAPSLLEPGIPGDVDTLVTRATARDRDLRPADAGVFLQQVRRVRQTLTPSLGETPALTSDLTPLTEPTTALVLTPVRSPLTSTPAARVSAPASARRRGPLLLIVALVLMGLLGGGAWWFGSGRFTPAPGLIGMTEADAEQTLTDAGLAIDLAPAGYSETVPAGQVMQTDPEAGDRVLNGGSVSVVLSLGKERYDVPKVRGKSEDVAQDAIAAANLKVGNATEVFDEKISAGDVVSTSPPAGTTLKPGTVVDLVVSKGRRPITIKDWTGKNGERATAWLEKRGLKPTQSSDYSDNVAVGRVISQQPANGQLFVGDTVSLVISEGPELVQIPRGIRASGQEAAVELLEGLGFKVETRKSSGYLGLGYVFSVDPGEGSEVPVGSTVTLYLV
jgi:eukaryotic-like serine/threonine-protein kinase